MITVTLDRPWLMARLPACWRVLSHAPYGAGYRLTDQVLWREVKNADLTPDFDVDDWFAAQMQRAPMAVGMMTSRDIGTWDQATATVDSITAQAVVTLGLSNAESVGRRLPWHSADYGTINLLVATDAPLTETAQLEALTIAVQARTAAVMALGLELDTGIATGTGTDCTALACPPGEGRYAGLHTAVGEAVGAAARAAVARAGADWKRWREAERAGR
ncbi:adenosylcobinamide amidohydrolase [Pseudogemmobacter blasticus]|uniref:Adenosylcobinamide amidohydrolase n=1 Tax=Fuscovulum blasticum DSM 2131 TaxID=1188250 RepID=A0A2T4J933_FUSBL|nr:adenosylcobinamide amidohydrolase [Fuscovulum blasticum]PTE14337.1 adenosylcobinamide amidohydrolase [Fuscovulum blasticum DSM 2131]